MPQEQEAPMPTPSVEGQLISESADQVAHASERRASNLGWMTLVGLIAELGTILFYASAYVQTEADAMLWAAGLAFVALLGTLIARILASRGKVNRASYILLITFALAYSSSEWILKDLVFV